MSRDLKRGNSQAGSQTQWVYNCLNLRSTATHIAVFSQLQVLGTFVACPGLSNTDNYGFHHVATVFSRHVVRTLMCRAVAAVFRWLPSLR
jgi:hypothetical protein